MKRKLIIAIIPFLQLLFFTGGAQTNELKFNLVEGPHGKRPGIRAI